MWESLERHLLSIKHSIKVDFKSFIRDRVGPSVQTRGVKPAPWRLVLVGALRGPSPPLTGEARGRRDLGQPCARPGMATLGCRPSSSRPEEGGPEEQK